MIVDFRLPSAMMYIQIQDSPDTCWAACAAGAKGLKARKNITEGKLLTGTYLQAWKAKRQLSLVELRDCYRSLGLVETRMDVSSPAACAAQIKQRAPIIVGSAITTYTDGNIAHQGYHVRLVIGCWGDTANTNVDAFQVRVFDPFPQPGFNYETPFLFSHFRYQMTYNSGRIAVPGLAWYPR